MNEKFLALRQEMYQVQFDIKKLHEALEHLIGEINDADEKMPKDPLCKLHNTRLERIISDTSIINCLEWDNIYYVWDLITKTEKELLKIPHFGKKSLDKVKEFLERNDLSLSNYQKNRKFRVCLEKDVGV